MGNLIATLPGDKSLPSVMLFAHMDQLGLVVRKIEANGLLRVERVGGVPETFIIDRDGRIVAHHMGAFDWSSSDFRAALKELLKQKEKIS